VNRTHRNSNLEGSMIGARSCSDLDLASRLLGTLRQSQPVREYRIERIQSAIHSDTYENDLKLSVAVDRLLCKLEGEVVAS
jgi:hypothetical protein